jgi:RNA polymerase sigma-70 factor (ECF subfamily)
VNVRGETKAAAPPRPSYVGFGIVRSLPFDGDEAALVAAMRSGRADAGSAFYERNVRAVQALVFRLMGPDAELDDVVHDVFVRALESLPKLRDPSALRSWLFGIACRAVMIRFQKRRRQKWLRFMAPQAVPQVPAAPASDLGEELRDVYAILDGMDPEERMALVLHRVEELSLEDGAKASGTSLSTFRRRLARAEQKFFARARSRPALCAWLTKGTAAGGGL